MSKIDRIMIGSILMLLFLTLATAQASGGTLNAVMLEGPDDNLDPAYKYTGWYLRAAGIYETLFSFDENMNLVPELATGYEQVSDTEYRIKLRDGVKFHDGTPMNADAVVYSIERVLDPANSRNKEYSFIDSVEKYNDSSIAIKTTESYTPLINSLTDPLLSIICPENQDINKTAVGTGPFKFDSYEKGVKLTVVRNDDYWGEKAKLDGAVINYVSDPLTRSLQLQSGDVDIARGIPQTDVQNLKGAGIDVMNKETLRTFFFYVNIRKAPFDNVKVRQAINYAINRQEIVDTALEGIGGVPAKGPFPDVLPWSANDKLEAYSYDPDKAKELLKEANISDTDGDGILDYQGKPFEVTIKTYTKRAELKPSAEVVASQLQSLGIKSEVVILESGALTTDLADGNYDVALYAWNTAPTGDPDYFLTKHYQSTGSEAAYTGYSNPVVDDLLEKGRTTLDSDKRKEYYDEVQKKVFEDSPNIFLFYLNELVGRKEKVKGYEIYPSEVTFLTPKVDLEA
jgi:peptide/nickel transport system substrate-binding protein